MIPPVALDVKPHHSVLDMCAAPGSKTCQILEIVSKFDGCEPKGFVVANDSDDKRAYMLVHQLRRLNSPAVFVTSGDAQIFPGKELFDRVLADVPCSGDGTVRKNPGIWRHWNQGGALSLHNVQLKIACRGAKLLKKGGRLVYSTCSLNPIENEAVVAEILRKCPYLQLLDISSEMPAMICRPGMTHWKVFKGRSKYVKRREKKQRDSAHPSTLEKVDNPINASAINPVGDIVKEEEIPLAELSVTKSQASLDTTFPTSWEEEALLKEAEDCGLTLFKTDDEVTELDRRWIKKSCFPPTQEEIQAMNLNRCIRVLPQDMDTGGFFVAVFHKKCVDDSSNELTEDQEKEEDDEPHEDAVENKDTKGLEENKNKNKRRKEKTNLGNSNFVPVAPHLFPEIIDHFGLSPNFPTRQIMSRVVSDEPRMMYFLTKSITDMIQNHKIQDNLTVINSGVKLFEKCKGDCIVKYRVNQDGVHYLVPHMSKRKISVALCDFKKCLGTGNIEIDMFTPQFGLEIKKMETGSFVAMLKGYEDHLEKKMYLAMWKCRRDAVMCLVAKVEIDGLQCKLNALEEMDDKPVVPSAEVVP